uniref:Link domain-containing protein n=1 Tax=Myripristis murdjan TaxID=586833 RepID=A0A667ZSZ9_9TELE
MARVWLFTHLLFLSFAVCTQAFNLRKSKSDRIAGIFMIPESGEYILNSTDAKTACQRLNATIATTAQMDKALQLGFEKCK